MGLLFFVIRLFATFFVLIGIMLFGFLIAIALKSQELLTPKLGQVWYQNDPFANIFDTASLPLLQAVIERKIYAPIWDPAMIYVLDMPAWLGLTALGVFFMGVGWFFLSIFAPKKTGKKHN